MCFDHDSLPPIPVISGAAVSHDDLVLEARRRQPARGLRGHARRAERRRDRDPPGRPRALPLLRGARAPLRRARPHGRRVRLLRADGGRREAGRRLRVHAARAADDGRGCAGRHRRGRRVAARGAAATSIFTVGFCFGGRHSWLAAAAGHGLAGRDRVLRPARCGPGRLARADAARGGARRLRSWR